MKYRIDGKEKKLAFGPYPDVSLLKARQFRDAARSKVREGADPAIDKKNCTAEKEKQTDIPPDRHELACRPPALVCTLCDDHPAKAGKVYVFGSRGQIYPSNRHGRSAVYPA